MDGSVLSAPYDPEKPREINAARPLSSPRTEVMRAPEPLATTEAAHESSSLSTITAPSPVHAEPPIEHSEVIGAHETSGAWVWIVVVVVAVTVVILLLKFA